MRAMKLGFASPVSLQRLRHLVVEGDNLPPGYIFAPAADWIQELVRRGHDVTVYTTAPELEAPETFKGDNLTIRVAPQRQKGAARDFFAQERAFLNRMMIEDQCDVIHAHWTYQFALAALYTRIPTLVTIHDLPWNVLRHFRDMHRAARLLMAYEVAFRAKHFTAVSQDAALHFRRYLNPGAEIQVIPNGVSDAAFEMGEQPVSLKRRALTFATILQGWSRQKNATAALRAFQIVKKELQEAQLLMFGMDYEEGGQAHQWAIRSGAEKGVSFVGAIPYMALLKRVREEIDVVVHPSLDESFCMVAAEAMALRKPVIAGKATPGVREVLGFGKGGVLTDVRNPAALARDMVRLARDADYRDSIAKAGHERASSLYRLGPVMAQYEDAYLRMLQTP
jgi:L-malate glycosyltransferase